MVVAFPRQIGAGLAPGMADLDTGHGARGADGGGDACESFGLGVIPQAQAAGGDAAFRRDAGGLDNHQPGATARHAGVVHLMPVVGETVGGGVLAHRWDRDAITERDILELIRRKQR